MKGFWLVLGLMASMPAHSQTTRVDVYTHNNGPIDYSLPRPDYANTMSQGFALGQQIREQRERQDKQIRDLSARGAAARERKCKSLALQLKWREEDLREAPLNEQAKARKMARRAAEKYRNDCQ